jgi:hypothetical protein
MLVSSKRFANLHTTVEKAKKNLTVRDDYRWNVDWFTEAVRRLSEAYLTRHDFGTVSMKATHRLLKVCTISLGMIIII